MPSIKELKEQAAELATALNIEVSTDDMTNADLSELVADLEAKVKDASLKTVADDAPKAKKPPYSVAQGCALTTKKGILADGDEIKAEWLEGGADAIKAFVKSGHIDKA